MTELSKPRKVWLHFKVGNKLIARDFWRWAKSDMWAWLMTLVTIVFMIVIVVFEAVFIANTWIAILLLGLYVLFCLFALWRNFKIESNR